MTTYFDDNFGQWNIEDESDIEHYKQTQKTNVRKKCAGCGRMVSIQPQYGYCNSCADKRERGYDI